MRSAAIAVSLGLLLASGKAQAQTGDRAAREAVLRTTLAARTDDLGARCELAFLLVQDAHFGEAQTLLGATLQALPAPAAAAERAQRGACLYNFGRAAEGLGELDVARDRYRASLALRPNATVQARLAALGSPATAVEVAQAHAQASPRAQPLAADLVVRCGLATTQVDHVVEAELAFTSTRWQRAVVVRSRARGERASTEWRLLLVAPTECQASAPLYTAPFGWPGPETVTATASVDTAADPRFLLRVHTEHVENGDATRRTRRWTMDTAVVAWLDAAGDAQSSAVPLGGSFDDGRGATGSFALSISFDARGRTVLGAASPTLPPEFAALVGAHSLPLRDVPGVFAGEAVPVSLLRALRGRLFPSTRIVERSDDATLPSLLLFTVDNGTDEARGLYLAAVASGGRWFVAPPVAQYYVGDQNAMLGADSYRAHLSVQPILPGGAPALVIEGDRDRSVWPATNESDAKTYRVVATTVVWPDGAQARTWTLPTRVELPGHGGATAVTTLSIAFDAGNVTVTTGEGQPPAAVRAALGTHPVDAVNVRFTHRADGEELVSPP